MPSSPRVEIAPGIFAQSVVKHAGRGSADSYQVYEVNGGVFDHFEVDSMRSLTHLVGVLAAFDGNELDALAAEPPIGGPDGSGEPDGGEWDGGASDGGEPDGAERVAEPERQHRRTELPLPSPAPPAAAHRRFACDGGSSRRARIWLAETLGDCLPDTDWSVAVLEEAVLRVSDLVTEAVDAGALAVLVALEIDDCRLGLTRFDEFDGGE